MALAVIASKASCARGRQRVGRDTGHLEILESSPEAREWLVSNGQPAALASNRFNSTRDALAFVDALYKAGAIKVVIYNINSDETEMVQGGPYADALVVRLPDDPGRRQRLFEIANPEFEREGFPREVDIGQEALYLWWD